MSFVSYAQNFEDVMLWRALKHVERGFYIDVGANDPEVDSVTKAFYDRGWHGINIEPVAQYFQRLEAMRLRDINLQVAAGAQQGELMIYELPDTGLSTFDKAIAERHEAEQGYAKLERIVPVETLTSICQRFHLEPIHFLKIDVEGAEMDVLIGLDLAIVRPWIVLVESTRPNTQIEDYLQWDPILSTSHYEYVYFDGLNRYYIAHEHQELKACFNAPPNVFDEFISTRQFASELRAQAATGAADAAEARALAAEARARELEQKNYELDGNCQRWWQQASAFEAERNALLQSRSWRITAPLRRAEGIATAAAAPLKRGASSIARIAIAALYRPFAMMMRAVLRRPGLSYRINQRLMRYPALHRHLLRVARQNGVIPELPVYSYSANRLHGSLDASEEVSHITPHARRIYADLKAGIEKNREIR
jgi:FkbM family methyltransferase